MTNREICSVDTFVDDYALARIDYRVRWLALHFGLSEGEQEDCRHDMAAELLSAFERFDPEKAKRETFITRVLDRYVKYVIRTWCARQRRACDNPIHFDDVYPGFQPVTNDPPMGELDEQGRCELRIDLADAISRMPERLQRVCRLLMHFTSTEAAERLGIRRQSIYRNMSEIKEYLTEAGMGMPGNDATNPCQLQM